MPDLVRAKCIIADIEASVREVCFASPNVMSVAGEVVVFL
jgi:hypothetical protein